jgi:hypothetical protein
VQWRIRETSVNVAGGIGISIRYTTRKGSSARDPALFHIPLMTRAGSLFFAPGEMSQQTNLMEKKEYGQL